MYTTTISFSFRFLCLTETMVGIAVPGQDPVGVNIVQYGTRDYTNERFGYI